MAKTVLIVEDNELNMKLFHDLLEAHGYETVGTRNGIEALDLARRHRPDLIVMDIQLPEVSGLEVTKWLKDDPELKAIPVVAVTAFAMKGDEERIREGGCEAYLSKPISVGKFLETVPAFPRKRLRRSAMTARILVVDDVVANVKLLEARLTAEYFDVVAAMSGPEALAICERGQCDIVLLDVMMPGMDGFEVCRLIKSNPLTVHVPVIMVTALDQPSDRVRGLEAGADDFLTKPVSDIALIARVRSLVRLKMVTDELRMRAVTSMEIGIRDPMNAAVADTGKNGRVLLVDDRRSSYERIASVLSAEHEVNVEPDPHEALFHAAEGDYDLLIVSLGLENFDGLRLCSQVRSLERIRNIPILVVAEAEDNARLLRGLEIGINDYLVRPVDKNEMLARVRTQVRKKRFSARLRDNMQLSLEMAITDALTGLHNRRYMESHLGSLVAQAQARGKPLVLLIVDIDFFKAINDTHGHDAGDDVLREFAIRLKKSIRGIDLACRYGGEEFVVVMPETDMVVATVVAERIRRRIATEPFAVDKGAGAIPVTISIGLSALDATDDDAARILKRADQALYRAKRDGRNRVVADAA
jgi:two-component system, cell cycle response regulator